MVRRLRLQLVGGWLTQLAEDFKLRGGGGLVAQSCLTFATP